MWLLVAALLVQQQPLSAQDSTRLAPPRDTAQAGAGIGADTAHARHKHNGSLTFRPRQRVLTPADTMGAYTDAGTRALVQRVRAQQLSLNGEVRAYSVQAREHFAIGMKALWRERLAFAQDQSAHIRWRRGETTRIDVDGLRQAAPIAVRGFFTQKDLSAASILAFDPAGDRLQLGVSDSNFVRHPLGPNSEAYYRFASGDTTTLRLPDGRTLRLIELRVIPRRDDVHLLRGSLWIDAASLGVVRGVFRLAADWDLEAELAYEGDKKDIPFIGMLQPIRASLRYMTIDYALVGFRWWLPHTMALEGAAQLGSVASFPAHYERVYSDYEVEGDTTGAQVAAAPAQAPQHEYHCRMQKDGTSLCECPENKCGRTEIRATKDSLGLIASSTLPPPPRSAFDEPLITEAQLENLGRALERIPSEPWHASPPRLHWGLGRSGLIRFNRVEGLSIGAREDWDFGPLAADLTGRLGVAPAPRDSSPAVRLSPDVVAGLTHETTASTFRLAAYRRLDAMDPSVRPLGFGNSFNALFFGRDDGQYFYALGTELTRRAAPTGTEHVTWRLFAEHQTAVSQGTNWSVPRLFGPEHGFQPNLMADRANEAGAELGLHFERGLDAARFRWATDLTLDGATGTFDYGRPAAKLLLGFPLPAHLVGSLEGAAGTSVGTAPLQRSWFLGGPATLRGYSGAVLYGSAFWRGRAEVATSLPGARLVLFSDAGWAGDRRDFRVGRPLYSAGVGASLLDGYFRLDLARALRRPTGWRLDLYLDGIL